MSSNFVVRKIVQGQNEFLGDVISIDVRVQSARKKAPITFARTGKDQNLHTKWEYLFSASSFNRDDFFKTAFALARDNYMGCQNPPKGKRVPFQRIIEASNATITYTKSKPSRVDQCDGVKVDLIDRRLGLPYYTFQISAEGGISDFMALAWEEFLPTFSPFPVEPAKPKRRVISLSASASAPIAPVQQQGNITIDSVRYDPILGRVAIHAEIGTHSARANLEQLPPNVQMQLKTIMEAVVKTYPNHTQAEDRSVAAGPDGTPITRYTVYSKLPNGSMSLMYYYKGDETKGCDGVIATIFNEDGKKISFHIIIKDGINSFAQMVLATR